MNLCFVSLGAGVLVGALYAMMSVRSPAPSLVALLGLLGMLIGEQVVPVARRLTARRPVTAAWFGAECAPKITGVPAPSLGCRELWEA